MPKLVTQLGALTSRAGKVEDIVAAAEDRDRQRLEAQREELRASLDASRERAAAQTGEAPGSWWQQTRASADAWFATIHAKSSRRREQWDRHEAEQRADEAESDAADAIDFALYALSEAEYAITDAALARVEADAGLNQEDTIIP
jgi:hypothetical protein